MRHRTVTLGVLTVIALPIILALGCTRQSAPAAGGDAALADSLGEPRRDLATAVYIAKRDWITALLDSAKTDPPTPAEANDLFDLVRHDPAFNVKVRAMAVLPFVRQREQAIDVLIDALKDREPESSGSGNVPLYATTYLAEMKATRAIPAIEDWLRFLDEKRPYNMLTLMLDKGRKDLAALKRGDAATH